MTMLFELLCCLFAAVPDSKLSHAVTEHHGFAPNLSHHSGKDLKKSSQK